MTRIKSALTTKDGDRAANAAEWRRLIDELNLRRRAAAEGGSMKARERHVARGKLLARERVAGLIDPASPFLEIGALAAFGM
jgi:3-methylcrotonyl-CoA carboxylase beta subunit